MALSLRLRIALEVVVPQPQIVKMNNVIEDPVALRQDCATRLAVVEDTWSRRHLVALLTMRKERNTFMCQTTYDWKVGCHLERGGEKNGQ